jgi:hypothetical protein
VKPNYFSKLVKQGKISTHKKRGSPKKFYYYSEVKPHFIYEAPEPNEQIEQTAKDTGVYTPQNNYELDALIQGELTPYQKTQIIKDFWAGKINEQKYLKEQGELVSREEIITEGVRLVKAFRDRMLALPTKVAPLVIGMDDIDVIKAILDKYVYESLEELSRFDELSR